ncbi:hypothetical protein GCM10009804_58600 [Kribbella hippodromi]|uniref:STAS domain-containing protein n=1 Tax=Kribbella hippodromi TaxID=434347 RepID=A0ABP4PY92_9ACTN
MSTDGTGDGPNGAASWVSLEAADGSARVTVHGALTSGSAIAARERLLEAFELATDVVVLDLEAVHAIADDADLPHLIDVAQRRSWTARCRLVVTASDPEIQHVLRASGL